MKLASYSISGEPTWGTIENEHAVNLGAVLGKQYPDLKSLIAAGAYSEIEPALASAPRNPLSSITWLPVIPNPSKILCVGLNYEKHRAETGRAVVGFPTIFTRFPNTQIGHMANIVRPRNSTALDYGLAGIFPVRTSSTTSPVTHATTMQASGIFSTIRRSLPPGRTSPGPDPSALGWQLQTSSANWAHFASQPRSMVRLCRRRNSVR